MYEEINKDSSRNKLMNSYFKILGEAHIENTLIELNEKEKEFKDLKVPDSLEQWFLEFHRKWKRKRTWNLAKRKLKKMSVKVAIFLAVCISFFAIITMSVEAFRIRFINLLISKNDSYTEIQVSMQDNVTIPEIDSDIYYYFAYLPEGYAFSEATVMKNSIFMIYLNGNDSFYFTQSYNETDYQLNTEETTVEDVKIGEYEGMFIHNLNANMVFWTQDNVTFLLEGNIPKSEMLKMAESMKKNN